MMCAIPCPTPYSSFSVVKVTETMSTGSIVDILERKMALEKEYGQIGCHEVKTLIEAFPTPEEDDLEEEFDSDEMEEAE